MNRLALPLAAISALGTAAFIWLSGIDGPGRVAILAVACVAHVALILLRPSNEALPVAVVLALSVGLMVAAVAARPQGTDLWAYQMYGRTVVEHDANPYRQPPDDFAEDPVFDRMLGSWTGTRAEYGPALVGTAVVVAAVTGENELAGRLAWQGLCGAAMIGSVLLLWRRTGSSLAMAVVGLNPLVGYHVVHLAHNDAFIGFAILAGVLLAADDRHLLAGVALTFAALVKAPAGLALVALLIWLAWRKGWRPAGWTAVVCGVLGLGAIAVAGGPDVLEPMLGARGRSNTFTPWNLLRGGGAIFTGNSMPDLPFVVSDRLATLALATSVIGALAVILVRTFRTFPRSGAEASSGVGSDAVGATDRANVDTAHLAAIVAGGLVIWVLLALYTSPWTFAWLLPVLALTPQAWLTRAVVAFVGLFTATSQWGIVTVAYTWLEKPGAATYDDINAVAKSALLLGLLALLAAMVVDTVRRAARPPDLTGRPPTEERPSERDAVGV